MNEQEIKEITKAILTSPAFIQSLVTCYEQMSIEGESINNIAAWFFSQGYLACLEYQEKKERFKSFSYEDIKRAHNVK